MDRGRAHLSEVPCWWVRNTKLSPDVGPYKPPPHTHTHAWTRTHHTHTHAHTQDNCARTHTHTHTHTHSLFQGCRRKAMNGNFHGGPNLPFALSCPTSNLAASLTDRQTDIFYIHGPATKITFLFF